MYNVCTLCIGAAVFGKCRVTVTYQNTGCVKRIMGQQAAVGLLHSVSSTVLGADG